MPAGVEVGRAYVTVEFRIDEASKRRVQQAGRSLGQGGGAGGGGRGMRAAGGGAGGAGGVAGGGRGIRATGGGAGGGGKPVAYQRALGRTMWADVRSEYAAHATNERMQAKEVAAQERARQAGYGTVGHLKARQDKRAEQEGKAQRTRGLQESAAYAMQAKDEATAEQRRRMAARKTVRVREAAARRTTRYHQAQEKETRTRGLQEVAGQRAVRARGLQEAAAYRMDEARTRKLGGRGKAGLTSGLGLTIGNIPRIMAAFVGISLLAGAAVGVARIFGRLVRASEAFHSGLEKSSGSIGKTGTALAETMGVSQRMVGLAQQRNIPLTPGGYRAWQEDLYKKRGLGHAMVGMQKELADPLTDQQMAERARIETDYQATSGLYKKRMKEGWGAGKRWGKAIVGGMGRAEAAGERPGGLLGSYIRTVGTYTPNLYAPLFWMLKSGKGQERPGTAKRLFERVDESAAGPGGIMGKPKAVLSTAEQKMEAIREVQQALWGMPVYSSLDGMRTKVDEIAVLLGMIEKKTPAL